MQGPTFLILASLAEQPRHGYGIVQAVAALSDGEVTLRPGTLYGALERLGEHGLIEMDREEVVEGRLRRYYRLTTEGATTLGVEADRLQRHADAARAALSRRVAFSGGAAFAGGAALPGGADLPYGAALSGSAALSDGVAFSGSVAFSGGVA